MGKKWEFPLFLALIKYKSFEFQLAAGSICIRDTTTIIDERKNEETN